MPDALLSALKLLLLAAIYLFFVRVLRAVWAEMTRPQRAVAPAPGAAAAGAPMAPASGRGRRAGGPRLRVVEPSDQLGKTFELGDEVTVGRASGCQVSLTDTSVSQLHARIFQRDGRLYVEDLGSTNGTFLNRKKVSAPVAIRRGDRIALGATVLEVVI